MTIEFDCNGATEVFTGVEEIKFNQDEGTIEFMFLERKYQYPVTRKIKDLIQITR